MNISILSKPPPLVGIGAHLGADSPLILLENGAAIFGSDLVTIDNVVGGSQTLINVTSIDSPTLTTMTSELVTNVAVCENSLDSSYCVDQASVVAALAKAGESFKEDQMSTSAGLSSTACIQFCASSGSMVS